MQVKTTGIVLHSIKYSDSASIVTVYTRHFGRVSYMVHGVNKKKSICRAALLQSLSIVEMDVFHAPGKDLQRIKDLQIGFSFASIPYHPIKNSLALFLAEVLFRTLRQTEPDESLFLFLDNSIQQLDLCEAGVPNFHLVFLMKMSRYLGFEPNRDEEGGRYFDLINGVFLDEKPQHSHFLTPTKALNLAELMKVDYATMDRLVLGRQDRTNLLESIIEYYRLHIPEFHGLLSLDVLKSLFD